MESKTVNENFPEEFRNDEEFGYMAGYELWKKLIFDRFCGEIYSNKKY